MKMHNMGIFLVEHLEEVFLSRLNSQHQPLNAHFFFLEPYNASNYNDHRHCFTGRCKINIPMQCYPVKIPPFTGAA